MATDAVVFGGVPRPESRVPDDARHGKPIGHKSTIFERNLYLYHVDTTLNRKEGCVVILCTLFTVVRRKRKDRDNISLLRIQPPCACRVVRGAEPQVVQRKVVYNFLVHKSTIFERGARRSAANHRVSSVEGELSRCFLSPPFLMRMIVLPNISTLGFPRYDAVPLVECVE